MSIIFGSPEANAIRRQDAILNCEPLPPGPTRADMERELRWFEDEIADLYYEIDKLESQAADLRRYLANMQGKL